MTTAKYDRDGISFQYPENWVLEEDPPRGVPRTISVTSSAGAFWSATVYVAAGSLEDLEQEYIATFREEYDEVELDPIQVVVGERRLGAIDLQFYCLDFLVCAKAVAIKSAGVPVMLLLWQAEDREFTKYEPVFRAITVSLLREQLAA